MSHYFESGYTVREPAWHGLATVLDDYPESWEKAREYAGLLWDPVAEPVYARRLTGPELMNGITAILENKPEDERADALAGLFADTLQPLDGFQRTYRSDDYAATLGTMTTGYTPITHAEFGEIIESVLAQPNVKYETAGSVEGGRKTWALALLDEPIEIAGDASVSLPYLALTARHDGTGGVRLQDTSVRVVCANTFAMAEAEADQRGAVFTFKHAAGWRDRLPEAADAIRGVRDHIAAYKAWAADMLGITVTAAQEERFVVEFIPMPPDALISDRVAKNVEQAREAVRGFLASPTIDGSGIRGTGYGLLQAGVEYLDWYRRTRNPSTRFDRQLLRPDRVKAETAALVLQVAAS